MTKNKMAGYHQRNSKKNFDGHPTLHPSFPDPQLGDALLQRVRDNHKVIGIQELPRNTSTELTRQRLDHHQNEKKWAENSPLMDTNTHSNLFAVLAINMGPAPSIHVHALDNTDSQFLYAKTSQCPPEHFPRPRLS